MSLAKVLITFNIKSKPVFIKRPRKLSHSTLWLVTVLVDILRVLQKLLKYFNGTVSLTPFLLGTGGAFLVIFILDLNDSEFTIALAESPS